jgi:hypothetical protein
MDQMPEVKRVLADLLRQRHRLGPNTEDDFTIIDMTEISDMLTSVSSMMDHLDGGRRLGLIDCLRSE